MATHPAQLLILLFLGVLAAAVLVAALVLLRRAGASRRAVFVTTSPTREEFGARIDTVISDRAQRRRARWMVAAATVMLLAVFAGRFLVAAFYPRGEDRPELAGATVTKVRGASGAELVVAHSGNGDGPTLVFTHGWGADRRDWAYAIGALPQGYRVVTWDLPGLGESSPTAEYDYSIATLAADLDRVVTSVPGPVILVGHSIGGILNIEYARRYPEKMGREVVAIVQANTTFTNPIETKKNAQRSRKLQKPVFEPLLHVVSWASPAARVLGWLAYTSGMAHLQLASQSFAGEESWEQLDEMARYAYRSSPGVVARGVLGMLHWDGSDMLAKIRVPTLVISGNQDVTTLPAASDWMAREIPHAVRVSVDPAAHLGPVEQYARYAGLIDSFASKAVRASGDAVIEANGVKPAQ